MCKSDKPDNHQFSTAKSASQASTSRILLVAGSPDACSPVLLRRLVAKADFVVAVDRGADRLMDIHQIPDAFVGDADTVSSAAYQWLRDKSDEVDKSVESARNSAAVEGDPVEEQHVEGKPVEFALFSPKKDYTDLGLACDFVEQRFTNTTIDLSVCCASAGRADHFLSVFGVLAHYAHLCPILFDDAYECRILSPTGRAAWALDEAAQSHTFSAVALAENTYVSESGFEWNVDNLHLPVLLDRGISNRVMTRSATIRCECGICAAFLHILEHTEGLSDMNTHFDDTNVGVGGADEKLDQQLENYLAEVDRYLRHMPVSEKTDIFSELKSSFYERLRHGQKPQDIIAEMGSPRLLAMQYLGTNVVEHKGFSFKRLLMLVSFYSAAAISWMALIPTTAILSFSMYLSAGISVLAGFLGFLRGFVYLSVLENARIMVFMHEEITGLPALFIGLVFGAVFVVLGMLSWKATIIMVRFFQDQAWRLHHEEM